MFENEKFNKNDESSNPIECQESQISAGEPNEGQKEGIKDGLWSQAEIFKFIAYLIYNRQGLKLKLQRRTSKVFKQMSLFIGTRSSVQCRSQNQRLFRKYKNIRNIVNAFKDQYGRQRFEEDYSSAILCPAIKFKTEYQNYLENQTKKSCDVSTQTEQFAYLPTVSNYMVTAMAPEVDYYRQFPNFMSNWVIVPFCS